MGYMLRETIGNLMDSTGKRFRYAIRRRYLRKDNEKFNYTRKPLSKEQKREVKAYWKKYTKHICYNWHTFFYSLTGDFDVRYIPEDLMFTEIEGYLNDWSSAHGVDNKNNYQYYFSDVRQPKTAFHYMRGIWHLGDYSVCTMEQALESACGFDSLVIKNALDAGKGASLKFWKKSDGKEVLRLLMQKEKADVIAQEFISQHPALAAFNPSSVNSIRIVTFVFDNEIKVLAAYLRMGQDGAMLDNVCAGGLCCAVNPDGTLKKVGYDRHAVPFEKHPNGIVFDGFRVPGWNNVVATAKKLHQRMGNFRIISWDFAVDEDEQPVFIEMNLKYGAMEYHQLMNGPLFGKMTDRVLDEIYGKKD